MKDQMLIDKYNELGKAHAETVNRLLKKDELIKERDELIKDAFFLFSKNVKMVGVNEWIEKAKKLIGDK